MNGHHNLHHGIPKAVVAALIMIVHGLAAGGASDYIPILDRGIKALDKKDPDSAIVWFVRSYAKGLGRDSLFYFWSEALLQKGILDSALAANFIVSSAHAGDFRIKVLLQRAEIYRQLGWNREALQILDTVRSSSEYRRANVLPEVEMGMALGYGAERRTADTAMPWGTGLGGAFSRDERGPFGRADIRASWKLTHGKRYVSGGASASVSHRQFSATGSLRAADSTDVTGSVFASLVGQSTSSTVAMSLHRRLDDSLFIGGSMEGGIIGGGGWLPMLWTGSAVLLSTEGGFSNARIWMFASAQQAIGGRFQINYHLFANASFERTSAFGFNLDTTRVLYADDARRAYPGFYTDESYGSFIDTSLFRLVTGGLRNDILRSGRDSVVTVGLKQPFSGLQVAPRLSLTLKSRLPVQLGLSWKLQYFWDLYEWDQILFHAHYLVYSRADGAFYAVPDDPLFSELTVTHGADGGLAITPAAQAGPAVFHHVMRRIDNSLSADLSFYVYDGRFGSAALKTVVSRTWSTLMKKSPFEIPEWSASAFIEWRMKISSRLVRR